MRINEKYEQIEKCENINFDDFSFFWMRPPMKNIKKSKNVKIDFDGYLKYFFGKTTVYIRNKINFG